MRTGSLFAGGLAVVLLGFALIVVGSLGRGNVSTGGFILIGPFPIVFGTGSNGGSLAALSVALGILIVVLLYVSWRQLRNRAALERPQDDNA